MKRLFTAFRAVFLCVLVVGVAACAWSPERKKAAVDAALQQIQTLNGQGIDPITASPEQLALITAACGFAPVVYPEGAQDLLHLCTVIQEAAQ